MPYLQSLAAFCGFVMLISVVFRSCSLVKRGRGLPVQLQAVFSALADSYLRRRYRVTHVRSRSEIPTCPWQWPNGQGDVGKFLSGFENSIEWNKSHGQIYRLWSGFQPEIALSMPDQLKSAFQDSDRHLKAPNNDSGYFMSQLLGKCLGLISGDEYRQLRATLEPSFTFTQSKTYLSTIQRRVDLFIEQTLLPRLERQAKDTKDQKPVIIVDPVQDFKYLPFLMVADILYGGLTADMESELMDMAPLRERLFQEVVEGSTSRYELSKYLPTRTNAMLCEYREKWHRFNDAAYRRAVAAGIQAPILHLFNAIEDTAINAEHCYQTLDEMLFANLDVTMGALSWNLVFLAAHPSTVEKLRLEQSKCFGAQECGGNVPTNKQDYIQKSQTFLAACILESARLKPLAAFTVPQALPETRTIGDYTIPAKTSLIVDSAALNISSPFWGDNKHEYYPERFLELSRADLRYRYWRFGFGPRQCLGKYIADLILRSVLNEMVCGFDMDLTPELRSQGPQLWKRDERVWISQPLLSLEFRLRDTSK